MAVVFLAPGREICSERFAAVPLRCRGAGPPPCLSWQQAAALTHVARRHTCLQTIVNVPRGLRKRHGPRQGASCWPKNGATHCEARRTALTASDPVLGPRCGGRVRVRVCAHECVRAQSARARNSARGSRAGRDEDIWAEDVTERKSSPKKTAPAASGSGTDSKRAPFCRPTTAAQTVKPDSRP